MRKGRESIGERKEGNENEPTSIRTHATRQPVSIRVFTRDVYGELAHNQDSVTELTPLCAYSKKETSVLNYQTESERPAALGITESPSLKSQNQNILLN